MILSKVNSLNNLWNFQPVISAIATSIISKQPKIPESNEQSLWLNIILFVNFCISNAVELYVSQGFWFY